MLLHTHKPTEDVSSTLVSKEVEEEGASVKIEGCPTEGVTPCFALCEDRSGIIPEERFDL